MIRDVIVYEQTNPVQDNFIIAKSGVMSVSADKRFLEFNLKNGWRYQERTDNSYSGNTEYVRLGFKEYKKQFDLSSFQFVRTDDSVNKNSERVMSMRQLDVAIDSLKRETGKIQKQLKEDIFSPQPFTRLLKLDSAWKAAIAPDSNKKATTFTQWLPDSARLNLSQRVSGQVNSLRTSLESTALNLKERERVLRKHEIEWHKKIALSLACLVLFLIGAPLGSIIRK